jgi:CHAD domain-containing protein
MKAVKQFAKKRFSRLHAVLTDFPAGREKEELHEMRLEIKKIKAVLRLIHFNDNHFRDHKHYLPFRTIFRQAGKIRDAGLRHELLEQYTTIHSPFFRSPDKEIKQFIKEMHGHIDVVRKQKKKILAEISKIKSRTYTLYLHKKNNELNDRLSNGVNQKKLHLLRKLIKEVIYLTSIHVKKSKIDSFLIKSDSLIGSWHDKKVLIPWIRSNTPKEKATITLLQRECNEDMQQLRKMIQNRE